MPIINGNNNNNTLAGGTDNDVINALNGADVVNAGAGNDTVYGGTGGDVLNGDANNDVLFGEAGTDQLFGGTGDDLMFGGTEADTLNGGDGNDTLAGGAGADALTGGNGIDAASYADSTAGVTVNLGTGATAGGDAAGDTFNGIENLIGSNNADVLTGNSAANGLFGGGGNDTLDGGLGDDSVSGGVGNDSVLGGDGNDTVEGGAGEDNLSGGAGTDSISGGMGNDTITGGDGDDVIDAGPADVTTTPMDLNWSSLAADGTSIFGGATQNTGGINVGVSFTNDGRGTTYAVESTATAYTAPGETINPYSNLLLGGTGAGNTSTTTLNFSAVAGSGYGNTVNNVQFRLNDIDANGGNWTDVITIRAFDAAGNPVTVTFTPAGNDTVGGNVITAGATADDPNVASGSMLITIGGPVARIEIDYNNLGTSGQVVYVSDVSFVATSAGDNDVVDGGLGADAITGGAGNDSLTGGDGADTVDGGAGNDTLSGGIGDDSLTGAEGDDLIAAGDGTDRVFGGTGNDNITFGLGDDSVYGGEGNDQIDDIGGGALAGNNLLDGGAGNDTIWGGDGNDSLLGGEGDDNLSGDGGADTIFGGNGNDTIAGDAGRDTVEGGAGADVINTGADEDFIYGGIGDTVNGGNGGIDLDVLDLSAFGKDQIVINRDPLNRENGTVDFYDVFGTFLGSMSFTDIETIIPCFTPGTLIVTDQGEVAVEDLVPGDLVLTRDNGFAPLLWVGRRDLSAADLVVRRALRPVRIAAGALGLGRPARDMLVSPQHRLLIDGPRAEMLYGEAEVLVAAVHLVGQPGITRVLPAGVGYVHLLFDSHEIVLSDGLWSESFQPAAAMLDTMDRAAQAEVLDLFPDLAQGGQAFASARISLKAHEARVLLAA